MSPAGEFCPEGAASCFSACKRTDLSASLLHVPSPQLAIHSAGLGFCAPLTAGEHSFGLTSHLSCALFGCLQVRARHGAAHPAIDWLHPVMAALQSWLMPLLERHMHLLSKQALQQVST